MSERNGLEIAVIGMAGRFPRARNLGELWRNLRDGVEAVSFFTMEELAGSVPRQLLENPGYVRAAAVLEDPELFDAAFFDLSPREAEIIDPQHRLLLESGWEALESAGYAGTGRVTGVFAGATQNTYLPNNLLPHAEIVASIGLFGLTLANEKDFAATRLAYKLNLEGPAVTVQTACSTSLVAIHLACQSLLAGECEMALAGGVSVRFPRKFGHLYQPGGILSPDGHTRAFDALAEGTAGGQGVGIVVLKLLEDALADGDHVHAVIRGSAINNDGGRKPGFTAPRRDGQAAVIRAALERAEVDAGSVGFVEAHGTATPLGDPVEVAALTRVFRARTERRGFCALGSIKTNMGHLDAAAGVASFIKAVLAVEHAEIPPSLFFATPNPEIDLAASPFYVNTELVPWDGDGGPRRAGVSSFGIGGTNAHVVLEEAPAAAPSGPSRPWQLLTLSARTPAALERMTDELAGHLAPGENLADIAFTLRAGRRAFRHRRALVAADGADAAAALAGRDPRRVWTSDQEPGDRPLALLLPGVGDQYAGMAAGLYRAEPVFREEIDGCAEILLPHLGLDLREALAADAEPAEAAGSGLDLRALLRREEAAAPAGPLHDTRVAQPAVFAVGYALARLWASWGVRPQALLGYSLGEYTAACLAGVLSLEDALVLVARRAALIGELPTGAMLAVPLPEAELARRLSLGLAIAAVNAPAVCVASGPVDEIAALEERLAGEGVLCRRLQTSHAFHSPMMEPIVEPFRRLLGAVALRPPQVPWLSNVTGTWARADEVTDPAYWVRHLCGTVRFADAAGELWREPGRVLLEAGPGPSLASLALQHPATASASRPVALASLRHAADRQDDQAFLLGVLGQLWLAGADIPPLDLFRGERRRRLPLPTYPFDRQRYFIERPAARPAAGRAPATPTGKIVDPAGWFHAPSWKLSVAPAPPRDGRGRWLVLADGHGLGDRLAERLERQGREVTVAVAGEGLARLGDRRYSLDTCREEDYEALFTELGGPPDAIAHLWTLTREERVPGVEGLRRMQEPAFHSLLALARALGRRSPALPVDLCLVTNGLCAVERTDPLQPEKAILMGPVRVLPQEILDLACRAIDVDLRDLATGLADDLAEELGRASGEPVVARRGGARWVPGIEPVRLPPVASELAPGLLRRDGVYLITGGLGGLGLGLAEYLARTAGAQLVLVNRTPLPERATWSRHLENPEGDGDLARRIRGVKLLERAGAEVLVAAADVADEAQMREVVLRALERFGRLDGAFHLAGLPGAGLVQLKTREAAERVIAPKAEGALVLAAVLRDVPVDFIVLFSALASLVGGIGQIDYAAANAFLDAFARHSHHARGYRGPRVLAVDWCEWQWDAWSEQLMAADSRLQEALREQRRIYGLTAAEGMEALLRALASGLPQVIVSTRDLAAVLAQQHSVGDLLAALDRPAPHPGGEHARPALPTPYVQPGTPAEERLAALWRELLGVEQVGIHDDFFLLGGHSLLGLQLMTRIGEAFGVELPLDTLFAAPTVAALAATVDTAGSAAPDGPALPEIPRLAALDPKKALESLDALSEEEMDALLAEMAAEEEGL